MNSVGTKSITFLSKHTFKIIHIRNSWCKFAIEFLYGFTAFYSIKKKAELRYEFLQECLIGWNGQDECYNLLVQTNEGDN